MRSFTMGGQKRIAGAAIVTFACLGAGTAVAAGEIAQGQEVLKVNLGGIVSVNNTDLRLDSASRPGSDFELESVTGLEKNTNSFFASGTWRFAPNHRIGVDYFSLSRDYSKVIDRELVINGIVIPVNTTLKSEAETSFFITNYQYSIVKNESMEFAGVIGLYGANLDFRFNANNPIVNISASTTAPLPMFGLSADFFLSPQWTLSLLGEGLKVKIGDVDGSMYHFGVSTDYMFSRNWGVGLGYRITDIQADVTSGDFRGSLGWRMDSYSAYLHMRF